MSGRPDYRVYFVTDARAPLGVVETARRAVAGGATMVQLRDKHAPPDRFIDAGRALKRALAGTGAALLINDRIDEAIAIGADGAHVGQSDVSAALARERLGPTALIGLSIERSEQLSAPMVAAADYLGVGPVFATSTKPDHAAPLGLSGLAAIVARTDKPVVAIGGLAAAHASSVRAAGAAGMATVSAIANAPDPRIAAREIKEAWEGTP